MLEGLVGKTVLVLDDEPLILGLIAQSLGRYHISTQCVDNVFSGLDYLELNKENLPGIVLTDYNMPRKNGIEFVTTARKVYGYNGPVVFMTGQLSELLSDARKSDVSIDYLLAKPFTISEMYDELKSAVSGTKSLGLVRARSG